MITLAAPCRALIDSEPLTVRRDDLVADISEEVKDVHYRAAVAVDSWASRRARHALRPRKPAAAPGAARRPRRVGPERAGHRRGGDRRDPRPPPHRLDRDARSRRGDLRSGWLDGDARRRALPPGRPRAGAADGADAARGGAVRHRLLNSPTTTPRDTRSSSTSSASCRSRRRSSAVRCSARHPTCRTCRPPRSSPTTRRTTR